MPSNPKLEKRKASSIAFIEHQGPYDKVPMGGVHRAAV